MHNTITDARAPSENPERNTFQRVLRAVPPIIVVALFAVALAVLHHTLRKYHYRDIVQILSQMPGHQLFSAILLTFLSYATLTGYDTMAFRYLRNPLPYSRIGFTSFIGYAFSNNVGFANLAAGSVRYRLYSAWGLPALDVAKIIVFCSLTFWLGFMTLGIFAFLAAPLSIPPELHMPMDTLRPLGAVFACVVLFYFFVVLVRKTPIRIKGVELQLPSVRFFFVQIAVSCLDWALAAGVLYCLIPRGVTISYPMFLSVFLLAQVAGILSHVPGGLGVFETIILLFLTHAVPSSGVLAGESGVAAVAGDPAGPVLAALLAYRLIYYLLPLFVASVFLGGYELQHRKEDFRRVAQSVGQWLPLLVPQFLAVTCFVGGAILLLSGSTPPVLGRWRWLVQMLPLPVLELSHFMGSLAGVGLLLLSRGLQRRLDAAYFLALAFLAAGVTFSLLKGLDYEEAIILATMFVALAPCRRHFYRKTSLTSQQFTAAWIAAIAMVVLCSLWLGIFAYKRVDYSDELWWKFSLRNGDAPRFLRASVGVIVALFAFSFTRLLKPARPEPGLTREQDFDRIAQIVSTSKSTAANLALLGDKHILYSESGRAFLMYGVEGRSWVALGDPVGPEDELAELVWAFRDLCDRHAGWPAFYQVQAENIHMYLDLGLTLLKLGEEARVRLDAFTLEGRSRKEFRNTLSKFEKLGCQFEVIPQERVREYMPELRRISETWLAEKNTREKGFSLGFFDEHYLRRFPVAVARLDGTIAAFANVWAGAGREEISLDLMRHDTSAPAGIMDYMFVQLMLWGKQEGYRWFNLGVAPLSGLENRNLAPLWHRLGSLVFRHGEHFYNFQGLRRYKAKFEPEWKPVYLASPGGLALPRVLTSTAALISGGMRGIFAK